MFPIQDTIPTRHLPIMNWILIGLNSVVFLFEVSLPEWQVKSFFYQFGLVPAYFSNAPEGSLPVLAYFPFFTSMFLHGGWAHFIGNMWTLHIFGDNVEDRMGPGRYLLFYILTGLAAGIVHYYINSSSTVPALGASGAIAGVMGAYMLLFPHSKIIFVVPLFFLPYFFEITAFFYIAVWFIGQLLSGTAFLITSPNAAGIAFWAHIGGFVAGVLLYRAFLRKNETWPPAKNLYENPFINGF